MFQQISLTVCTKKLFVCFFIDVLSEAFIMVTTPSMCRYSRLTDIHICQYPVDELAENLSRFLYHLAVLCSARTANISTMLFTET